ncbi:MAG TPA: thiamine phosphate synthase [Candidatus Dormibacteraeota bacterium]|jgi:thiamine-phosphate pyrophosphorylase|nr:thiamine phosphate synthase [Candidatus Dormibacteraeota bacterium]
MSLVLPPLYVILDAALLTSPEIEVAKKLNDAGVRLFQYRNKRGSTRELFQASSVLAAELAERGAMFFVNDRPDVAFLAGASGVHVGLNDLPVAESRAVMGQGKLLGLSTHNLEQFRAAAATDADYIALGPVFATDSKANPGPVVGTAMIQEARKLTRKPIVAIGGITFERAKEVIEAGADSAAVISDVLRAKDPVKRARQFLDLLEPIVRSARN